MTEKQIKFTHEKSGVDLSYIALKDIGEGEAVSQIRLDGETVELSGLDSFEGEIVIDLDKSGKILGFEIIGDVIPDSLKES